MKAFAHWVHLFEDGHFKSVMWNTNKQTNKKTNNLYIKTLHTESNAFIFLAISEIRRTREMEPSSSEEDDFVVLLLPEI